MSRLEPVGSHELIDSRELTGISKPFAKQPAAPTPKVYLSTRAISILTLAALLTLWWAVTAGGWIEPLFLPPPADVLSKGWLLATKGYMDATLWQHLGASLQRIGLALAAAILTAIPIGIAIGHNRIAQGIFDPLIEFYRPIPPLAYLPLIVIWFGIGEFSKVLLIYLAIFAPIAIATATGVRTVDPTKVRAAQSLGATRWQLIRHVVLPSALPDILTGIRIGLGVGWSTLVAAELIAATSGLGFVVQSAAQFLVTDVVVLGILVIAVIAFAMELGLRALQRRLVPWHGQQH
ncbi:MULTISPECIES: taurine ABC transporter permease TauC [Pseudomonas syringae group]|uniref:Taurine ABC transporter permease n=3 Tax=Pseudomonas syringae group TaxID=136849 RepID=A0A0P9RTT9_PSESX|nr:MULTISPECIES: taurine ABC transporter permease TauC [Pseudomonas syringae group]KPB60440.1 Taurine ABC transporter permease [Pseudomonas amygdali pv. myricae]GFZ61271.1 taurine ABC transporter permease [Pseudomonas amygdali pv. eriobotryae]EGH03647.1 taurine ABC transporter permease [Pseudomonas amygdali pv. aesculi str. 0893_23]KPW88082.1 Taurine ABC transporter permease [Pseudomonas syringae pv. cerasicola]KPY53646.1 Taurine ABC transporter permease [Pseudomonas syringae pv. rhaphiolepidi